VKGALAALLADDAAPPTADLRHASQSLLRWDCRFTVGSVGASLFAVFWWKWCERVAAARFPRHLLGPMAGAAGAVAHDLLLEGDFGWFAKGASEDVTVRSEVRAAMSDAIGWLIEQLGPGWQRWTWGRVHPLTLRHALSAGRPIFATFFDVGPRPCPGSNGVLNQNSHAVRDRFWTTGGPHYRFLADLAETGQTQGVNTAGNSGNPASPHYADQLSDWLEGRYHPLWMNHADVDAHAEATAFLTPADGAS
jgi:penicillin amidase